MSQTQKIAFITGGNRGIGLETALQLGLLGVYPVIGARSEESAKVALSTLAAAGVPADWLLFDANEPTHRQNAYDYFERRSGRLDILINNAGVFLEGQPGIENLYTAVDVPESVLRQTLDANFFAPILLTQKLLPLLRQSTAGRIVNLSSILASLTLQRDSSSSIHGALSVAYDSSKTALNAFTVHLAKSLEGTSLKVNAAHPGWVQTDMGGSVAPMSVIDGAKTSVLLATLPQDGPNGGFFHMGEALPW